MCTAISVCAKNHYFGRNLDYFHTFGEKITITPRHFAFNFKNGLQIKDHYAFIGMSLPEYNYPLYFDAVNEKGVGIAGLNFVSNAVYNEKVKGRDNIASFELIPYILCRCDSLNSVKSLLKNINITNDAFADNTPPSPLHWLISDKHGSITVEQTKRGLEIYDNPVGVLTNNPTFDIHLHNLSNYMSLGSLPPQNNFCKNLELSHYSEGMGALGLPGDMSSMSRFIRASFVKSNSVFGSDGESVVQFFHILNSVYQQKGCVFTKGGYEITNYSSCCNTDTGIYYYTTYHNSTVNSVSLYKENLDSENLIIYPLNDSFCPKHQN